MRGELLVDRTWDVRREIAYLYMKIKVSTADQSDREFSSRLCNDWTLRTRNVNQSNLWLDRWKRGGKAVPFVTALLTVPLVCHPRRDVCPGYPRDTAFLPGHHRSYYRGQFLDFFGRPSAYVVRCKLIQTVIMRPDHVAKFGFLYLYVARRDVRDGYGSDLCSWQGIFRAAWISHPTCDRVLGWL